jgi:hypothetical protein
VQGSHGGSNDHQRHDRSQATRSPAHAVTVPRTADHREGRLIR